MYIGITGHQRLSNPNAWSWVEDQLNNIIANFGPGLIAVSSLAIGADQLFANVVLKHNGKLYAVLPFENYEETIEKGQARDEYLHVLKQAVTVEILKTNGDKEAAYLAAGKRVADIATFMVAVWDGNKAAGVGGTGDIVEYTKDVGKEIIHINPDLYNVQKVEP